MMGALWASSGVTSRMLPAERALEAVLAGSSVAGWNDSKGRTQAEVLAAFDKAIAAEEAAS